MKVKTEMIRASFDHFRELSQSRVFYRILLIEISYSHTMTLAAIYIFRMSYQLCTKCVKSYSQSCALWFDIFTVFQNIVLIGFDHYQCVLDRIFLFPNYRNTDAIFVSDNIVSFLFSMKKCESDGAFRQLIVVIIARALVKKCWIEICLATQRKLYSQSTLLQQNSKKIQNMENQKKATCQLCGFSKTTYPAADRLESVVFFFFMAQ